MLKIAHPKKHDEHLAHYDEAMSMHRVCKPHQAKLPNTKERRRPT